MKRLNQLILVRLLAAIVFGLGAAPTDNRTDMADARGALFDAVAKQLVHGFYDKHFRETALPVIIEQFRSTAHETLSLDEEKKVIDAFLSEIPASHLALLSGKSYEAMFNHLLNRVVPMVGFELIHLDDGYFVHDLLEGGPADRAGIRMGDRVVSIDGDVTPNSQRLDWSTDDAALPDPGIHALLCKPDEAIALEIERTPGERLSIEVNIEPYSAFIAAAKSERVYERGEHHIGYLHLHYIHMHGPDKLLADAVNGPFKECDAVILDLRGRGGNAMMVGRIVNVLSQLKKKRGTTVLALIDQNTRSAKEAIAWELRDRNLAILVGEKTAGALLPASFAEMPEGAVLMYPAFKLGKYSDAIEGIGVEPHIPAEPKRAYTNGHDPLIETALQAAPQLVEKSAAHDI